MFTYFIVNLDCGQIKIGRSRDPKKRFLGLQAATGADLWLLGVVEEDCEKEAHHLFKDLRIRGEWFKDDQRIRDFLTSKIGFFEWLKGQVNRDDWIGDVARDAISDRGFPKDSSDYARLRSYLNWEVRGDGCGACKEAKIGMALAFREWRNRKRRWEIFNNAVI